MVERNGERYVAYNIYMAGRHLCSRRYREFSMLHQQLKREFPDYNFPKMPGKWPFQLTEQQLDSRRRGLEQYLEKVCAVRVIAECDTVQEFLCSAEDDEDENGQHGTGGKEVELKVLLPDKNIISIYIKRNSTADAVYQNYSTATSTCLCMKKWVFTRRQEKLLCQHPEALKFIYWQAVDEVSRGLLKPGDKLFELKALQESNQMAEMAFPHCACDSRKGGHVIAIIGVQCLKLQACKEDGSPESQVIEFPWDIIQQYEADDESVSFNFEYTRQGRKPRWFVYMYDCFERIKTELSWEKEVCDTKILSP
ncbi:hypothetical protein LSH36_581g02017 [Paralvinella palmiformis]|uniref:PX domain-containing protein n=1 Tax=Paralvinella palmiformis TaxID=53620 RepID=A0AAD9J5L0_9ANNE|nr:hypothetical protein LSH36_581g02017 [Paralvinella palmiformis]